MCKQFKHWIPISEGLPELETEVLVCLKGGGITIGERVNLKPYIPRDDTWFLDRGETNAYTEDIIAWMPLPTPYKEGDK